MNVNYQSILKKIADVSKIDSQPVYFIKVIETRCPDCPYDPITGSTGRRYCPSCGGTNKIITEEKLEVIANVEYITGLETQFERGGKFEEGTVIVTVHRSELERVNLPTEDFRSDSVSYIDVNNRRYTIQHLTPQYLHGYMYEIIFRLNRYRQGV